MTLPRQYVDAFLVAWDAGEYEAQVKAMRQTSQKIGTVITVHAGEGRPDASTAKRAQAVRERLARTARRVPEVMVKITSSCRGMTQIGRHIDYISRKGQIDLEDQDRLIVRGKDRLKELKEDWRMGGLEEIGRDSDRRDTLNIVFSMPAHTDEVGMKRAVRAFTAAEFEGHQYVFSYHTQATDPDPNPPAHPHVHLSVKTLGRAGRRLNPRKADLQRWREDFAEHLRAHGIDANATSRLARLKRDRGDKRSILALKAKGHALHASQPPGARAARATSAAKLEAERRTYYELVAQTLAQSDDSNDRILAQAIMDTLDTHMNTPPSDPDPKISKDRGIEGR